MKLINRYMLIAGIFILCFMGIIEAQDLLSITGCQSKTSSDTYKADVIVYGGTAAAVTAAIQVARMGRSVIIVSPDTHPGGLSSSGLGFTDTGNKEVIGGLAREFYQLIYQHYQESGSWNWQRQSEYGNKGQGNPAIDGENRTMWIFEPHAAEEAFELMIKQNNIKFYRDEWLDRETGVVKNNGTITSIKTLSGKIFSGKIFIDATYEGDLMASAGVKYTIGRESGSIYNEKWNGVQKGVFHHGHYFKDNIDPYKIPGDPSSGLIPRISSGIPGENGNWPYNIYVREARRMIGEYVMTENDVLGKNDVPRPVGMGSYTMNSHNVQRYVTPEGFVQNEGDFGVKADRPYQIDLGSILPSREECRNLLVPVCVSSSHIAFSSIRMEPIFMILGQSAGTVASMSIERRKSIYDLSYEEIKTKLESDGQILKH